MGDSDGAALVIEGGVNPVGRDDRGVGPRFGYFLGSVGRVIGAILTGRVTTDRSQRGARGPTHTGFMVPRGGTYRPRLGAMQIVVVDI